MKPPAIVYDNPALNIYFNEAYRLYATAYHTAEALHKGRHTLALPSADGKAIITCIVTPDRGQVLVRDNLGGNVVMYRATSSVDSVHQISLVVGDVVDSAAGVPVITDRISFAPFAAPRIKSKEWYDLMWRTHCDVMAGQAFGAVALYKDGVFAYASVPMHINKFDDVVYAAIVDIGKVGVIVSSEDTYDPVPITAVVPRSTPSYVFTVGPSVVDIPLDSSNDQPYTVTINPNQSYTLPPYDYAFNANSLVVNVVPGDNDCTLTIKPTYTYGGAIITFPRQLPVFSWLPDVPLTDVTTNKELLWVGQRAYSQPLIANTSDSSSSSNGGCLTPEELVGTPFDAYCDITSSSSTTVTSSFAAIQFSTRLISPLMVQVSEGGVTEYQRTADYSAGSGFYGGSAFTSVDSTEITTQPYEITQYLNGYNYQRGEFVGPISYQTLSDVVGDNYSASSSSSYLQVDGIAFDAIVSPSVTISGNILLRHKKANEATTYVRIGGVEMSAAAAAPLLSLGISIAPVGAISNWSSSSVTQSQSHSISGHVAGAQSPFESGEYSINRSVISNNFRFGSDLPLPTVGLTVGIINSVPANVFLVHWPRYNLLDGFFVCSYTTGAPAAASDYLVASTEDKEAALSALQSLINPGMINNFMSWRMIAYFISKSYTGAFYMAEAIYNG